MSIFPTGFVFFLIEYSIFTHCDITMDVPNNIITHCDVTIGISSNVITNCDVISHGT